MFLCSVVVVNHVHAIQRIPELGQTNFSHASAWFVCPFPLGEVGVQSKIMSQGGVETEFVFETAAFQF